MPIYVCKKIRRHSNKHGLQGTKSGSRRKSLKILSKKLKIPFGKTISS